MVVGVGGDYLFSRGLSMHPSNATKHILTKHEGMIHALALLHFNIKLIMLRQSAHGCLFVVVNLNWWLCIVFIRL